MKILFLDWKGFGNEDVITLLKEKGHAVTKILYDIKLTEEEAFSKEFKEVLSKSTFDFLFSFNYYPVVSNCCEGAGLKYAAWVYDSPYIHLYSYTVPNSCNYIFVFDYGVYEEFQLENIKTVYYMPLAVSGKRLSSIYNTPKMKKKHECEVAFVGSMYSEAKHQLYDKFKGVDEFTKGYLDGIINAQLKVYGYNFLQEVMIDSVLEQMQKVYPTNPNDPTIATPEYIYAEYVLARQVTALERQQVIELISERFETNLYTNNQMLQVGKANNRGKIDYYDEMPFVFMNAKINLNITLKSIRTGIPLRAMDIMGCGGFLISNYQQELFEYFKPDQEFVYYEDYGDLMEKTAFYLEHDEHRRAIAQAGCRNIMENHTYEKRLMAILDVIGSNGEK